MTTPRVVLFYALGVSFLFTIYSFFDFNLNVHVKPIVFEEQRYPIYYEDRLNREWPFSISKNYNESSICRWQELNTSHNISHNGIGEAGAPFVPSEDVKELMEELRKKENYNLLASDMISLHRSLPQDLRPDECKILFYPEKLPTTSVIIIFHNEAWTTILRTVWSVLDRSPPELVKEIILVDDFSSISSLKRPLDDYIELLPLKIKLIRTSKREGLIRARLIGARNATGNVLTFLDAHMECSEGWLPPLLARIANDRSVIAVPAIDTISSADMSYRYGTTRIHGFRWSLIFDWMPVPERERIRTHNDETAPLRSPTMIGCGFSIDREFFFEIGSYDEEMNIWGSENMEISLRVWQCGGSMEILPCSHVGHLFRISTYSFDGDASKIKARNNARLIEVWMSDFKDIYYTFYPYNKNITIGDLTERQELKRRLKCKHFRWFLDNVYPESLMRKEFIDFAEIKSVSGKVCLDIDSGDENSQLTLFRCHGKGGNQRLFLTNDQMILTRRHYCIGVDKNKHTLLSVKCVYQDSGWWKYENETKWLVHIESGLCMFAETKKVVLEKCDAADDRCKWDIKSIK